MAQDLSENQKHLVEKERMHKELEMCRKIQEELLPRQTLRSGAVEIKGVSIPAQEVGGDFFNYFPMPGGNMALLIGDVSGKGLPAALLMANLQATIQARLPLELDLVKLAEQLNGEIEANNAETYLTLFLAVLDPQSLKLRYIKPAITRNSSCTATDRSNKCGPRAPDRIATGKQLRRKMHPVEKRGLPVFLYGWPD